MKHWLPCILWSALALFGRIAALLSLALVVFGALVYREYDKRAEAFDLTQVGRIPERSAVFDRDGHICSYLQGENRLLVPLSQVPPDFIHALLAREDTRFWQHSGIDFTGIARALLANWRGGSVRQGASTITQQLARNSFGLTARTIDRKILEAMLARRIERRFSKREILQFYINRVYLGAGVYGLQRAAQVYFGKPVERLSLPECALLAGLIRNPNRMSPIDNPQGALTQRNEVLNRMLMLKMVTPETAAHAKAAPVQITGQRRLPSQHSYVMDAVRRDLDLILSPDQIDQGGLRIYTTIDPVLQTAAEEAVTRRTAEIEAQPRWQHPTKADFDAAIDATVPAANACEIIPSYLQAAAVVIDNRTGAIRAIVGGRDYERSKFDRATLARRQAGSTFKPFVYATAFQRGLLPGSLVRDGRIRPGEFKDLPGHWSPQNSDGEFGGWLPAAYGLIQSRNTMSVRVGEYAGLPSVLRTARLAGFTAGVPPYPVVFLGGFETTLKNLATAYTAFPNRGDRVQSYLVSRIENAERKIIFQVSHASVHALKPGAAWLTSGLLEKVLTRGTAAKAAKLGLTKPAGGKTGTTNEYRDAWFVGYTSSLTCGVWVGFDHPRTIQEKGYGATLALPIWVDLVQAAPEGRYPARPLAYSEPMAHVRICAVSGGLATPGCNRAQTSYPADLPPALVPTARCTLHDSLIPILAAVPVVNDPSREPASSRKPDGMIFFAMEIPRWQLLLSGINGASLHAPREMPKTALSYALAATALPAEGPAGAAPDIAVSRKQNPARRAHSQSNGRPTGVLTRHTEAYRRPPGNPGTR